MDEYILAKVFRVCWGLGHLTLGECVINMEWNYIDHKLGVFVQSPLSPLFSSAKIFPQKKEGVNVCGF